MTARAQWACYAAMLAACMGLAGAFFAAWNGRSAAAAPPEAAAGTGMVSIIDACRIDAWRIELMGWAVMKNASGATRTYVTLAGVPGHLPIELPVRTLPRPDVLTHLGLGELPLKPGFAAGTRLWGEPPGERAPAGRELRIRIVDQSGRSVEARHAC